MAEIDIDEKKLLNILDVSLEVASSLLLQKCQEVVPRDKNRLPNPIFLKTKSKPERNIRSGNKYYYRNPVRINGSWYEGVTGNLARSLGLEKLSLGEYIVGVRSGPTEEYAKVHEFGSSDGTVPRRSFLLDPLVDNSVLITKQAQKTLTELLSKT